MTDTASNPVEEFDSVIQEDDWQLPMEFHLFAVHERHELDFAAPLAIECVERLTPLDMMSLSAGIHDATGHCVWLGAFLFLAELPSLGCFDGQRILELGTGTGIAGLGILQAFQPDKVVLTDADPDALALCRRNCAVNEITASRYQVQELTWGEPLGHDMLESFDIVVAADVLYDIGLLPALFTSAEQSLVAHGRFILAHVPRACYNSSHPPVDDLESHIVARAREFGFQLEQIVRPKDDYGMDEAALNFIDGKELQEIGAAILIFEKQDKEEVSGND